MAKQLPSIDRWLEEAKLDERAGNVGMYLTHNGVVRITPKQQVRAATSEEAAEAAKLGAVEAVEFSYDAEGLAKAVEDAKTWPGVYYVRVWLNEGRLSVGDSLMYVLIGADIRPNAVDALQKLVGHIKNDLVVEREIYAEQ
ncbi:molybdenum cofactor biosynthesis protein MoaE [uncultured Slackia sp.]|uniref:molybdenum cofactor biosynthesis protein MoaE n=1 Tax=uncultured Slackia sp. TaxID=665903 RepID=UPI0026DFED73|nr:molybdenum cofactor biosynthesis protein MoaE [uncultured Slackia sp.]